MIKKLINWLFAKPQKQQPAPRKQQEPWRPVMDISSPNLDCRYKGD